MHAAKVSLMKLILGIALYTFAPKRRTLLGDKFPKKSFKRYHLFFRRLILTWSWVLGV